MYKLFFNKGAIAMISRPFEMLMGINTIFNFILGILVTSLFIKANNVKKQVKELKQDLTAVDIENQESAALLHTRLNEIGHDSNLSSNEIEKCKSMIGDLSGKLSEVNNNLAASNHTLQSKRRCLEYSRSTASLLGMGLGHRLPPARAMGSAPAQSLLVQASSRSAGHFAPVGAGGSLGRSHSSANLLVPGKKSTP